MNLDIGGQKLLRKKSWLLMKHVRQYSNLIQAYKREPLIALGPQPRGT